MNQNLVSFLPLVLMLGVLYFFMIRPQKKREKEINDMRSNLKVGDKVISIGGIVGEIVIIKDDYVTIETTGMKNRVELTKWGIGSVIK